MDFIEAKICLLGDSGVGKSSLVTRFVHNTFNPGNESTIGASFMTKTFIYDNITYKLNIWDTAGQERETFRSVVSWVRELETHLKDKTVLAIAANKADLNDKRQVPLNEAKQYAESIGALFVETSAKSALNVQQLFCLIATRLPKQSSAERSRPLIGTNDCEQRNKDRNKCC